MSKDCILCSFKNPKGTATAVIIRDGRLLLMKRAEAPFKDMLDLPGGYMSEKEAPEETLQRELKEELGVNANLTYIKAFPGGASWKEEEFPIISFVYLADIGNQTIKLNHENSDFTWLTISDINPDKIAFDSNQAVTRWVKENFNFDMSRVRELVRQLDDSAKIDEQCLYRAVLNGYVAREFDGEKLIGMGWIFPRQTALRKQAVVEDMILDDTYRGRGLGRKLLDTLVKWAKAEGVEMIELTSNPKRIAANELYKKYGFVLHSTNHYLYKAND